MLTHGPISGILRYYIFESESQCFVDLSQHDLCMLCSTQSSLQTRGVCIVCSFVQHFSKAASAAASLLSWDPTTTSLYLAMLHQPLQPALPILCKPELQQWHGVMLDPMQQSSTAEAPPHATYQSAESKGVAPCGISNVSQAWHPTGILAYSSCYALCNIWAIDLLFGHLLCDEHPVSATEVVLVMMLMLA